MKTHMKGDLEENDEKQLSSRRASYEPEVKQNEEAKTRGASVPDKEEEEDAKASLRTSMTSQNLAQRSAPKSINYVPLSVIPIPEEPISSTQAFALPSNNGTLASFTSPLLKQGFFSTSPQARPPAMPYFGAFSNTPNLISMNTPTLRSRGSPSAFSSSPGPMTDFGSMFLRSRSAYPPANNEGSIMQSPYCLKVPEGFGLSPTESMFRNINLPK